MESIRSATGLRCFRMGGWFSRLERSKDIHGSQAEDILRGDAQTGLRRPEHIAVGIPLLIALSLLFASFSWTVAQSKGHEAGWWFFGGLLFGPLALLASIGLPDLKLRRAINDLLPPPTFGQGPRDLDPPERIQRRPSSAPQNPVEGRD